MGLRGAGDADEVKPKEVGRVTFWSPPEEGAL